MKISIIVLISLVVVWGLVLFAEYKPLTSTTTKKCPNGKCVMNKKNGEKRCGPDYEITDEENEICVSGTFCDSYPYIYPINSDGSTNEDDRCENGEICRCSAMRLCSDIVTSKFVGDPARGNSLLEQVDTDDPTDGFCQILPSQLPYIINGRCEIDTKNIESSVYRCMRDGNVCLNGNLTYVPSNIEDFDGKKTPLSCMRSAKCPANTRYVYNSKIHEVECVEYFE